jgi:hypothetical protein
MCQMSLCIREMQIKTSMLYYFSTLKNAKIKLADNAKCWRGSKATEILIQCYWECKLNDLG